MEVEPKQNSIRTCSKCGSTYKVFIVNGSPECKECYDKMAKKVGRLYLLLLLGMLLIWYFFFS